MTREEMIERARAWLAKNHPLAPAAEHQVTRYADFALAVLEEERVFVVGMTKDGYDGPDRDCNAESLCEKHLPLLADAHREYVKIGIKSLIHERDLLWARWHRSAAEEASRG